MSDRNNGSKTDDRNPDGTFAAGNAGRPKGARHKVTTVRIDGHYASHDLAAEIADLWAENPFHPETRIVVAEIRHEAKAPKHWDQRNTENGELK